MDENSLKKEEGKKKRLLNLRPIKKGEIRNPHGRPKKELCLTSLLKEELEKICPAEKANGRTWKEMIVLATMRLAISGKAEALKEVWQRTDGRVVQGIDLNATVRTIEDELLEIEGEDQRVQGEAESLH